MAARIMILNGPNLNFLGIREPHIYGSTTLKEVEASCQEFAKYLGISISFHQSNLEGELVNLIQSAHGSADAIIMNPRRLFVYVNRPDRCFENIRRTKDRGSYLEYSRTGRTAPSLDHLERFYSRHLRPRPLRIHRRNSGCRAKAGEAAGYGPGAVERHRREQQNIDEPFGRDRAVRRRLVADSYSITACSGATDCLRSAALVEPIMIARGIAHRVKIITIW